MCFSVPCKVIKVEKNDALIEGGRRIKIGNEFRVKQGDYLQVLGDIAVGKLSKFQGLKVRNLIKSLNVYDAKH